jgi:hypothetical protein
MTQQTMWLIAAGLGLLALAGFAYLIVQARRRALIRNRFGAEYEHTVRVSACSAIGRAPRRSWQNGKSVWQSYNCGLSRRPRRNRSPAAGARRRPASWTTRQAR